MFVLHDIDCIRTKHFHNSGWVLFFVTWGGAKVFFLHFNSASEWRVWACVCGKGGGVIVFYFLYFSLSFFIRLLRRVVCISFSLSSIKKERIHPRKRGAKHTKKKRRVRMRDPPVSQSVLKFVLRNKHAAPRKRYGARNHVSRRDQSLRLRSTAACCSALLCGHP